MYFWQLTIDAHEPAALARFWAAALGYVPNPPSTPDTPWHRHYRSRLGGDDTFEDRLFDPEGRRPPLWFQRVPEDKAGKNRLHVDIYPTERDNDLGQERRVEIVDECVARLVPLGARIIFVERDDDPEDPVYYVVMQDPEGNEFCVS